MIILGLNAFHGDSSAALVRDGKLIAAAEEERFRRVKHWAGFPSQAIAYCLREAGVALSDVQHVAINQDSRANLLQEARLSGNAASRRRAHCQPAQEPTRTQGHCRVVGSKLSRRAVRWASAPDRTSFGASLLGLPRFAVPGSGRRLGRWLRRFLQRRLGGRQGHGHLHRWAGVFSRIRSASSIRR